MSSLFHAFISYSRKDKVFAALLEKALEAYRHPSPDKQTLKLEVFRDEEDFAGSEYTKAIHKHLSEAGKLIVICSPAARASTYVDGEIRMFAELHGSGNIVPVLLSGLPNNEAKQNETDMMAFPPALCELMEMPLAVDYRNFDKDRNRVHRGPYYGPWCMLLANLLDTSRDVIDERIRKRRARILRTAITVISLVAIALASLAIWALVEKRNAIKRGEIILAEKLVSQSSSAGSLELFAVERRALLALEGMRRLKELDQPLYNAASALREVLGLLPKKVLRLDAGQTAFAFSPNGLEVFSAAGKSISVYNLVSGKRAGGIAAAEAVRQLFVSKDGRNVGSVQGNRKLMLWTYPEWKPWNEISLPADEQIVNAEFDKEGVHVAIITSYTGSGKPAFLRVWQKDSSQKAAEHPIQQIGETLSPPGNGSALTFTNNSLVARVHASLDDDSLTAILWRWRTNTGMFGIAPVIKEKSLSVAWRCKDAALSSNGESLYIIGNAKGRENAGKSALLIVNPANGSETIGEDIQTIQSVSSNGAVGISAKFSEDPYVPLLKYSTFTSTQIFTGNEIGSVTEFSGGCWLSPTGDFIVTVAGLRARLWQTKGGKEMFRIPVTDTVNDLHISDSERYLSTHKQDGGIEIWDLASPSELLRLHAGKVCGLSEDGRFIVSQVPGAVMIADNQSGDNSVYKINGIAAKAVFSADNRYLSISTGDTWNFTSAIQTKNTTVLDLRSRKQHIVSDTSETISAFSKTGDSLLVGEKTGLLKFIRSEDGKVIWTKRLTGDALKKITISPDGKMAVIAMAAKWGYQHRLFILELGTGKVISELERTSEVAAFNAFSTQLATVRSDTVEIKEISTERVIMTFKHPEQYSTIRQIIFNTNGNLLTVSGNRASNFMVSFFTGQAFFEWNIESGKLLRQFPEGLFKQLDYQKSLGEEEIPYFSDVLSSDDGSYVAVIQYHSRLNYWAVPGQYATSELRVWKLDGLIPVEVLRFPCKYEEANKLVAIASGPGTMVTSGDNFRTWSFSGEMLVKEGCLRLSRNFSEAEWNEYVGANEPYCETCPERPKQE